MKKIWLIFYNLFAKKLPISQRSNCARKIRTFYARHIMKSVGKNVNIERNAVFRENVSIGDNSGIGINCEVYGPTTIGKNVMMGPDVVVYTRNHKFDDIDKPMCQQGFQDYEPVEIGDDVWIGRRVMIMPGVKVGNHVVIAAGSVVTKDIEDYSVVGGVPARLIKKRK